MCLPPPTTFNLCWLRPQIPHEIRLIYKQIVWGERWYILQMRSLLVKPEVTAIKQTEIKVESWIPARKTRKCPVISFNFFFLLASFLDSTPRILVVEREQVKVATTENASPQSISIFPLVSSPNYVAVHTFGAKPTDQTKSRNLCLSNANKVTQRHSLSSTTTNDQTKASGPSKGLELLVVCQAALDLRATGSFSCNMCNQFTFSKPISTKGTAKLI